MPCTSMWCANMLFSSHHPSGRQEWDLLHSTWDQKDLPFWLHHLLCLLSCFLAVFPPHEIPVLLLLEKRTFVWSLLEYTSRFGFVTALAWLLCSMSVASLSMICSSLFFQSVAIISLTCSSRQILSLMVPYVAVFHRSQSCLETYLT